MPGNIPHPDENTCRETILTTHLRPAFHFAFPYVGYIRGFLRQNYVRTTSDQCVSIEDWLHAHAKYSPDALPVKEIGYHHMHRDEDYGGRRTYLIRAIIPNLTGAEFTL